VGNVMVMWVQLW